jgi:hypothetical protein
MTEYHWPVGNTGDRLHVDAQCPALRRVDETMRVTRATHPNAPVCKRCGGDAATGGGPAPIYERAKAIGEQRTEATNDD